MSELYLQKFELLRNFGFFIFPLLAFAVAVVFMSLSSDISKIGFVAVIILGSFIGHSTCNVSLKENSCFSSEENYRGYNPHELVTTLQTNLVDLEKSIQISQNVNANNTKELIAQKESLIQKIEKEKLKAIEYDRYPKRTEFIVLANLQSGYTLLSDDNKITTNFKLRLKKHETEDNYYFHECSNRIVQQSIKYKEKYAQQN